MSTYALKAPDLNALVEGLEGDKRDQAVRKQLTGIFLEVVGSQPRYVTIHQFLDCLEEALNYYGMRDG